MAQHGVILHSGGDRVLIDPPGFDLSLENPLLLRRALSFGVKVWRPSPVLLFPFLTTNQQLTTQQVIVSHCASEGKSIDLEIPPHAVVDNLSLFLRMMEDPKYPTPPYVRWWQQRGKRVWEFIFDCCGRYFGLLFGDISGICNFSMSCHSCHFFNSIVFTFIIIPQSSTHLSLPSAPPLMNNFLQSC